MSGPDLTPAGVAARVAAQERRLAISRRAWAVFGIAAMVVAVFIVKGQHDDSKPRNPEQTFIAAFNDATASSVVKPDSKAFLLRAGHGFCRAVAGGATGAQAKYDLSVLGVTDKRMADGIEMAARASGSLCPSK